MEWKIAGITSEGDPFEIEGEDVWQHEWYKSNLATFSAAHPQYPKQMHSMSPYYIEHNGKKIIFSVSEVSANVYCFYVLKVNT